MISIKHFIISALALVSMGAMAATQGELGDTSTGSFDNTFNGVGDRKVQVLGLQDATVNANKALFVTDKFCVVDSSEGAVSLAFTFGNEEVNPTARADDGSTVQYKLEISQLDGTQSLQLQGAERTYELAAGVAFMFASECGDGNLRKTITATHVNGLPIPGSTFPATQRVYTEAITITATPI